MVFVKGLTLRSGNFVFWDDELGYFNHSKNLFQDSISLFSEFVYNNDKNCVESVFKNGSDFSTILLLPEFVDVELDEIVDFIERLNEIKGFSIPLDYLLENGIETKDYKQYKNINISVYQEYSSLFRLRCVTNMEEPTYGLFNIRKEITDVNYESNTKTNNKNIRGTLDIQGDSEEVGLSEIYSIITSRCKCEIDEFNEKKNKQILTKLRNFLPDKNTGNNLNEISEKKLFYIKFKGDYNGFNIKIDHNKNINNENFLFDILGSNYYNITQRTIETDGRLVSNFSFDNTFKKVYKYIRFREKYADLLFLYSEEIKEKILDEIERYKEENKILEDINVSLFRTSLDLTNLKQYKILNIYNKLNSVLTSFEIDNMDIKFGVKPIVNDDGIFVEFGYFFKYDLQTNLKVITNFKKSISDFFKKNKNIREELVLKKTPNLNREVFRVVVPPLETNIVYICYFPKSKIIKVGKTKDWKSRERTYKKGEGEKPETKEYMKLIYWYKTITFGDDVIDRYLMGLTEHWLIDQAKKMYDKFDGDEFFQADEKLEILKEVQSSIGKLSIQDLLKLRTDKQIKRFCYGNSEYKSQEIYDKLMELKYNK